MVVSDFAVIMIVPPMPRPLAKPLNADENVAATFPYPSPNCGKEKPQIDSIVGATPNDYFLMSRRQRNRLQHAINGNPSTHSEGPLAVVRKLRVQGVDEGSIRTLLKSKGYSKSRISQLISTRSTSISKTTSAVR